MFQHSTMWHLLRRSLSTYVQRARTFQHLKADISALHLQLDRAKYLYVLPDGQTLLKRDSFVWVDYKDVAEPENAILLDVDEHTQPLLACGMPTLSKEAKLQIEQKYDGKFCSPMAAVALLSFNDLQMLSKAHSLLQWNLEHRHCSFCGGQLKRNPARSSAECSSCGKVHYPLVSPVIMTLVVSEDGTKVLLVRQPMFPPGMYSCISGFVEPGETVESTVHREVAEEVGLEIVSMNYGGSQHWSLPTNNLLIGCTATVKEGKVQLDRAELDDARWFSVEEVTATLENVRKNPFAILRPQPGGYPFTVPPATSLSNILIQTWLANKSL